MTKPIPTRRTGPSFGPTTAFRLDARRTAEDVAVPGVSPFVIAVGPSPVVVLRSSGSSFYATYRTRPAAERAVRDIRSRAFASARIVEVNERPPAIPGEPLPAGALLMPDPIPLPVTEAGRALLDEYTPARPNGSAGSAASLSALGRRRALAIRIRKVEDEAIQKAASAIADFEIAAARRDQDERLDRIERSSV